MEAGLRFSRVDQQQHQWLPVKSGAKQIIDQWPVKGQLRSDRWTSAAAGPLLML